MSEVPQFRIAEYITCGLWRVDVMDGDRVRIDPPVVVPAGQEVWVERRGDVGVVHLVTRKTGERS